MVTGSESWHFLYDTVQLGFNLPFYDTTVSEIYMFEYISDFQVGQAATFGVGPYISLMSASFCDRSLNTTNPSVSTISYQTFGMAGDKICVIDYKNIGFYMEISDDNESTNWVDFQIWFYENGTMEVHFGQSNITKPQTIWDGNSTERGLQVTLSKLFDFDLFDTVGETYELKGNADAPTFVSANSTYLNYISGYPAIETVYRFSRNTASLDEASMENTFIIYPNPTAQTLNISGALNVISKIKIMSIQGVLLKDLEVNQFAENTNLIEGLTLANGVYQLQIETASGNSVKKFRIQN
jgi:hypothetical protein